MRTSLLLFTTLALAACRDSSSSGNTSFDATVTDAITNGTNETSEPFVVEGKTFVFPSAENAFDDLLPPDSGAVVEQ
jgi:hypothetical protein